MTRAFSQTDNGPKPAGPLLFVHSSNEMYGSDRMLLEVLRSLSPELRHRSLVWLPADSRASGQSLDAELTAEGIRFTIMRLPVLRRRYMRPRYLGRYFRDLLATARELRRLRPAMVYCATSATLPVALLARGRSTRRILHCQEIWSGIEGKILGELARTVDRIVCISDAVRDALPRSVRSKAVVIHNAVPTSGPVPRPPTSQPMVRFLVASRWLSWKGHSTLLKAWDTDTAPGELVILGGPPPLGAAVDVPSLVERLKNPGSVKLVGEVPDIREHIDDCDVMVVPSDSPEPFGLVAIEAFSRGRGVIASDGGGLTEIVQDGVNGARFAIGDWQSLQRVLNDVDKDVTRAWGVRARAAYDTRFSPPAFHSAIRRLIQQYVGTATRDE